ncbi:sensor histidine kinase [Actinospica robiniae]|uniref:sensor histidine kinase n=1 Tax=Actinospica robiniae TaxID=304901 RepID=UPI0003FDF0B2|nr:histidine kinase [Actinospica robiniae]
MTPESHEVWSTADAGSPALERMRRYTTWVMVAIVAGYVCLITMAQSRSAFVLVVSLAVGALVCWQCLFWEKGARPAVAVPALITSYALLWLIAATHRNPVEAVAFSLSAALVTSVPPWDRWSWSAVAVALAVLPVTVFEDARAAEGVALVGVAAIATVRGNRFWFGLYLEIDQARHDTAELAVMRERYRFAADLHDIQGQALHVSRLKLQLADTLLDRDRELARNHIREVEQLVAETIAETRRLAYGERAVTLAGELANSESLVLAAGIELEVRGHAPIGHRLEELFALVVRETTTNLLRHAHAEHVLVDLGPDFVRIVNDGVTDKTQALSGLARLGARFTAVGGTLETQCEDGTFTTAARAESIHETSESAP